ncbi:hypothetical protein [Amycolatopsis sp. NPDC058986]|uniref:hypothetical protein n=1 Tax=unclassified Amycolatopsis TaxID=2618356 RepID=UPI0036715D69
MRTDVSLAPALGSGESSLRRKAVTGALHGLLAGPALGVLLVLIAVAGLWGRTGLDGPGVFFLMLLVGVTQYGLYAWLVVTGAAALAAAFGPAHRARRRAWLTAVLAFAVYVLALAGVLIFWP